MSLYVDILAVAVSGALVTFCYMRSLGEGMVFEALGRWLDGDENWKKPLGGCSYCTGFWITAAMVALNTLAFPVWVFITCVALALFLIDLVYYQDLVP